MSYTNIDKLLSDVGSLATWKDCIYAITPDSKVMKRVGGIFSTHELEGQRDNVLAVLVSYAPDMLRLLKELTTDLSVAIEGEREAKLSSLLHSLDKDLQQEQKDA